MISWPAWLPAPQDDLNIEVDQSSRRTRMESGRFRQRRTFMRQYRMVKVSWEFNDLQRTAFTAIFKHALNNGADWFYMALPVGPGVTTKTVRFVNKSYNEKYQDVMHWQVSATLEIQEEVAPYTAEEIADLILEETLP